MISSQLSSCGFISLIILPLSINKTRSQYINAYNGLCKTINADLRLNLINLQHVLAMFVGNLTPILIITSACAAMSDASEFAKIQVSLSNKPPIIEAPIIAP